MTSIEVPSALLRRAQRARFSDGLGTLLVAVFVGGPPAIFITLFLYEWYWSLTSGLCGLVILAIGVVVYCKSIIEAP